MQYYIRLRGREDGPFDIEDLKRLRGQGRFSTIHEVSHDRRNWQRASTLSEVFSSSASGSFSAAPTAIHTAPAEPPRPVAPAAPAAPPPQEEWYYAQGGQRQGPFRADVLLGLFQSGQLPADVHVWTPALGHWIPAEQVPQFSHAVAEKKLARGSDGSRWLVWAVGGAAAVLLLVILGVAWSLTSSFTTNDVVRGPDDREGLHDAVGRVFVGFETVINGKSFEIPLVSGTGFVVSKEGHLITSDHVVNPDLSSDVFEAEMKALAELKAKGVDLKRAVWVFFGRNEMCHAEVVKTFDDPDLAILKLDHAPKKHFRLSARAEPRSNSDVWTCGFPNLAQIAQSETEKEYASALSAKATIAMRLADKEFSYSLYPGSVGRAYAEAPLGLYWKVEHDAKMASGSSGGPLLDRNGTVIGINTLRLGESGTSFNISLSVGSLRSFIEQTGKFAEWVD